MHLLKKTAIASLMLTLLLSIAIFMGLIAAFLYAGPTLPSIAECKVYKLQTPMSVFSADNKLVAEFGDNKRIPVTIDEVPQQFIQALLATEDQRFYQHKGVDLMAMLRIIKVALTTGRASQGGSTLTMLVARNYFLDRSRKLSRKLTEIFLALKIERHVSKDEILEMLLNKIPFGHRTNGLGAAAQIYYGKKLSELSLPQLAILAGIPKGQSKYNPISNPDLAKKRRNHVLGRMLAEGYIDQATYKEAANAPITAYYHGPRIAFRAEYFAEMVRQQVIEQYGEDMAYNAGLNVYTTLNSKAQLAAREGLRQSLIDYDKRHGYRGPERQLKDFTREQLPDYLSVLTNIPEFGPLQPALVTYADQDKAEFALENGQLIEIPTENLTWAREYIDQDTKQDSRVAAATDVVIPGDIVRLYYHQGIWRLGQIPKIEGAFVALDPNDGAILALEGGFDFQLSKYNRVVQAKRQPGSNIKPMIYSAALEQGFTAASIINDAPIAYVDESTNTVWRPKNSGDKFHGQIRLREALKKSINLVSVRLMDAIGIDHTVDYLQRFGFKESDLPRIKSMALGSIEVSPLEVATAYATFANAGFKVAPYFIERIEDMQGNIIYQAQPKVACDDCAQVAAELEVQKQLIAELNGYSAAELNEFALDPNRPIFAEPAVKVAPERQALRVIEPRNAYIIGSMMHDVIRSGTAYLTLQRTNSPLLQRNDIGGKTGTANDAKDTWFSGYHKDIVASAWVGFDDHSELGKYEWGGSTALPIWQHFMEVMLADIPNSPYKQPPGLVSVRIDPKTGLLPADSMSESIFEIFRQENVPSKRAQRTTEDPLVEEEEVIF